MSSQKHYLEAELETLLREDPTIWEFLREYSLDGVWYWDLDAPEHEYMSPQFWRTFGFDPATKAHRAIEWQHLIHPEDLELAKDNLAKHLADPDHAYDQVVRYLCADGQTAWVRCRGIAVRDADGRATRLLGAHNDITAQMLEKQRLADTLEELETFFNATRSGMVAFDKDGRVTRINERARHLLGDIADIPPFDLAGRVAFLDVETLHPLPEDENPIHRALAGEQLINETHLLRTASAGNGQTYMRLQSAKVENAPSSLFCTLVIDDISEEERNRQVVERKGRLDALGQLTGGIAHDFNNMLAAQLYAIELAGKTEDPAKRATYLDIAAHTIERGRALTSRLLAFAKRQPGLSSSRKTSDVLQEFSKLIRPMVEAQIEISTEVEPEDLWHYCDQAQLETALMNMVLNSRDAILMTGKGGRIRIRARPVRATTEALEQAQIDGPPPTDADAPPEPSEDGKAFRFIEISVADDGPGMDAETMARCTDPFFTTKSSNSGTGLGLPMVYGFARHSDGDLRIYSEVGVGTTIQLTLPRGTEDGSREERMPLEISEMGAGETILVVEDEVILQMMMTEILEDLGYKVLTASTGQEALDLAQSGAAFDLLLTDVVMPGQVGGFELARQLREARPDLPVLYSSGYTGYTASEMGPVQAPLLQKPAAPDVIAQAVAEALHK